MSNPKQEAKELYDSFLPYTTAEFEDKYTKVCAKITCNKLIGYAKLHGFVGLVDYYIEVKNEIEKL